GSRQQRHRLELLDGSTGASRHGSRECIAGEELDGCRRRRRPRARSSATKISSPAGKTPIPTFPSTKQPKLSTQNCSNDCGGYFNVGTLMRPLPRSRLGGDVVMVSAHSHRLVFVQPELARIIHDCEDTKSLFCYKHVVATVFVVAREAFACPTIARHSVCCSPIFSP